MSQLALDLGVPSTLVTEAVYARCLSALKEARVRAVEAAQRSRRHVPRRPQAVHRGRAAGALRLEDLQLRPGLRAARRGGQGIQVAAQLRPDRPACGGAAASSAPGSWRTSRRPSTPNAKLENLLLADFFRAAVDKAQPSWRHVVAAAVELGIPVPAFSAALAYYDGYRRDRLPANLLQAQRDYFGAHTYQRIDKPGTFHTDWIRERKLK